MIKGTYKGTYSKRPKRVTRSSSDTRTPLMDQYYAFKRKYPDAILLFRVGDFYETFGEDAVISSQVLSIVLTKRSKGLASEVALAGFPHHALDTHLPKLIKAGHRVAICDQQETPEEAKARGSKIVNRSLIELATPALTSNESLLEDKKNRYLASLYIGKKAYGLSLLDISTGDFLVYEGSPEEVWIQLEAHAPVEVIFSKEQKQELLPRLPHQVPSFAQEPWVYTLASSRAALLDHFGTSNLEGFGVAQMETGTCAAGAILQYLKDTAHHALGHVSSLSRLDNRPYLWMDTFTVRSLELLEPLHAGSSSLLDVIDTTNTSMGGRLLRRWLRYPLKEVSSIEERQTSVEYLYRDSELRELLRRELAAVGDLERMVSKISTRRAVPRELLRLAYSLRCIKSIILLAKKEMPSSLFSYFGELEAYESLAEELVGSLREDAALSATQGPLFNKEYDPELDELLNFSEQEEHTLSEMQQEEANLSGISSLKVGYNRVFGYYLEVRNKSHKDVPSHWTRKQTLTGAERYTTPRLKAYEEKALSIESHRIVLEAQLFDKLLEGILDILPGLQKNASILSQIDVFSAWALLAEERRYVKPQLHDSSELSIQSGRHPVIEAHLPPGESYVPNDLFLNSETHQLLLITGPNMAGKSALLRQTALIVILAQLGAFVPAQSARIGLRDKIFTRVGASDNIAAGQSTFMVEMSETASILHNMSDRSLLLMDEIGRGTSTYDGLSVAWATLEYIHEHSQAPLLFATHYHELNELASILPRMKSFHVAVKELNDQIVFLYTLKEGGSQQSFGIHVARMAGMPRELVHRAEHLLSSLQQQRKKVQQLKPQLPVPKKGQPSFF